MVAILRFDDPAHPTYRPRTKRGSSRIGDSIKNKILSEMGVSVPCNDCASDINRLNLMQPSDVLDKLDWWTDRIFDRGKDKAHKWYQKLVVKYAPGIAKDTIRQWIIEACEDAQRPS
jgi:hypothetical protein